MGGRVGGPEAGVSRVLEGTAGVVVLVVEGIIVGGGEMAALGTTDGDGVNAGEVVGELTILVGVCARTLGRVLEEVVDGLALGRSGRVGEGARESGQELCSSKGGVSEVIYNSINDNITASLS